MTNGSQIFELFGYPVDSWDKESAANMRRCHCPFMGAECDGGGNRYASGIDLRKNVKLKKHFPGKSLIQSGVCSLQLKAGEQPWIVCPRRLLNYRKDKGSVQKSPVRVKLHDLAGLQKGKKYSVWSEIKMKCPLSLEGRTAVFDYTFDYIIASPCRLPISDAAKILGMTQKRTIGALEKNGFTIASREGNTFCEDFPSAPFVIVEVMTSSTCGGNKKMRTQVSQMFEDTVYKLAGDDIAPAGPGINYRQVWARMVSQLLVKSQIGIKWGGVTFWVLQDLLADYITKTTALNLNDFIAKFKNEVNVIAGGYGEDINPAKRSGAFAEISNVKLFAGPVASAQAQGKSFSDIIKIGAVPDVSELWKHLASKKPCATFVA